MACEDAPFKPRGARASCRLEGKAPVPISLAMRKESTTSLTLGLVLGVVIGVVLDNVAMGIGIGIALGIAFGYVYRSRRG
jgi:hypothetical protein